MKIVCIYHSIDLDGWMSAAIVKHWYNKIEGLPEDDISFIGFNYGESIPDLSECDKVILVDISFPKETMKKLSNLEDNFIWIDHHISAIKDNYFMLENGNEYIYNGMRDIQFAACELTWKYFFPDEPIPEIVRLLGRYDCFGHKGTEEELEVLQFQYAARSFLFGVEGCYSALINSNNNTINKWIEIGAAIHNYLCLEAKQSYKNGFEIRFVKNDENLCDNCNYRDTFPSCYSNKDELKFGDGLGNDNIIECLNFEEQTMHSFGYKFICINKERFNPINFGINYHEDGYDGVACFHYANGKWNFSLYNENGLVNCSEIAKRYGGGGHKGAAGFSVINLKVIKQF